MNPSIYRRNVTSCSFTTQVRDRFGAPVKLHALSDVVRIVHEETRRYKSLAIIHVIFRAAHDTYASYST